MGQPLNRSQIYLLNEEMQEVDIGEIERYVYQENVLLTDIKTMQKNSGADL